MKKRAVVIVAGGNGSRMRSATPKQFLLLAQKPILMHTIEVFWRFDNQMKIVVVLPKEQTDYWKTLCEEYHFAVPHIVTTGGDTRFASVANGLKQLNAECSVVAVHDGVRPLVSIETIERCFDLATTAEAVVPVLPSVESVRVIKADGSNAAADRSKIMLVQTPQVFDYRLLVLAYGQHYSPLFTDDASVVEALGKKISLCQGNPENIKITAPGDLVFAQSFFKK